MNVKRRQKWITDNGERVQVVRPADVGTKGGWWIVKSLDFFESSKSLCPCDGCQRYNKRRKPHTCAMHESQFVERVAA